MSSSFDVRKYLKKFKSLNLLKGESIKRPSIMDALCCRLARWLDEESENAGGLQVLEFNRSKFEGICRIDINNSKFRKLLKKFGWKMSMRRSVVVLTKESETSV